MERPTIGNTEALAQAGATIGYYLRMAKDEIDRTFQDGYAEENPNLVGICVKCMTDDFNAVANTAAMYQISDSIKEISTILENE
jgi:hypothetical protein